jgi:hypothetical protein
MQKICLTINAKEKGYTPLWEQKNIGDVRGTLKDQKTTVYNYLKNL